MLLLQFLNQLTGLELSNLVIVELTNYKLQFLTHKILTISQPTYHR